MAILAECPRCHKKQAVKNRKCVCGEDLVKAKRAKKVRYWVNYRLHNGTQRREFVGNDPDGQPLGIEDARAAEGKRKAQKYENPGILEKVPAEKMTVSELSEWYLDLNPVKKLASFVRVKGALANFNNVLGDRIVSSLKPLDLEDYQEKREDAGKAPATIDMEISLAKTMVTKAFDNDIVDGRTVKAFRTVKRKLRKGDNARKRTLTIKEYLKLVDVAPAHLKDVLTVAFNTGMRTGELRGLRWSHIDHKAGVIRLTADLTKEKRAKIIPMNHHVKRVLGATLRILRHDFVFTYQDSPISSPGGLRKSFLTACKRAEIPHGQAHPEGLIFHDMRRTVKTNMVNAGVDQVYRDKILGHSLHGMDVHYMSPSIEDLHRAMARYTEWLDSQFRAFVDQTVDQEAKKG
jgi:integrase